MPFTAAMIRWNPKNISKGCSASETARTKPLTTIFIDINLSYRRDILLYEKKTSVMSLVIPQSG